MVDSDSYSELFCDNIGLYVFDKISRPKSNPVQLEIQLISFLKQFKYFFKEVIELIFYYLSYYQFYKLQ